MRVIVLNGRKLFEVTLLICVICILYSFGSRYSNEFKIIGSKYYEKETLAFNNYISPSNYFEYELPKGFISTEVNEIGEGILSKVEFYSDDNDIIGDIEVMNFSGNEQEYLKGYENKKEITKKVFKEDGVSNYRLSYDFDSGGIIYKGIDYYKFLNEKIYKIRFIAKNYDEYDEKVISEIFDRIKLN